MNIFRIWFTRLFSNAQLVSLILILVGGVLAILLVGHLLTPVLAAVVLAYLLEAPVDWLHRLRVPRTLGAALVSIVLLLIVVYISLLLLPMLTRQAGQILQQLPELIEKSQAWISSLPERYPSLIGPEQMNALTSSLSFDPSALRKTVLSQSLVVGVSLLYLGVYLVLVPLMVFFMLRDKVQILAWLARFAPHESALLRHVWSDVNVQLGNYIRGKAMEIVIVWVVAYVVFKILGLDYAMLLSALVGFSVLIPYVGAFGMTIPVMLVAYSQWGFAPLTLWTLIAYTILQMLDGNALVPILFSGAVNLHPVAIIAAVLFFGGIWGLWGVFFAIPLATVIKSVIDAWPRQEAYDDNAT